jgi:hypothetical protein
VPNYYVAGGLYGEGTNKKFSLVRPTKKDLPYVSTRANGALSRATKRHAHFYSLNEDYCTLELVQMNWNANGYGVGAPMQVVLEWKFVAELKKVIEKKLFYD